MFLVGISCVSAENIDELGTSSSDDVISTGGDVSNTIDNVESDVSTDSVDDERISDIEPSRGNTYTWDDFKSEVENTSINTVHLNQGNIAPSTSSSNQVSINHDVTIVGGYGYYIGSADWSSAPKYNYIPMITTEDDLNVKFENVTFQYLSNNIFIKLMGNGNYTFKNCIFDHINATGSHQSVIWLNYGHALIENCTFTNCKCSFGAVTNYYSSAPSTANYARMTVKDSTFKDNNATTEPGAINNCGYLEVYDTIFENNRADWWAGAIHTHMYANTTIVRSNFTNNLAGWNGGALYTYSYLRVVDSNFIGNTETTNTGGGAIGASNYGSSPTVIIENSRFENNTALTGNGGAVFISSGTLTVTNSNFTGNKALKLNGGAISCGSCTSTITNSVFKYNSAILGKGGAISGGGNGRLTVDKCEFDNNAAKDDNSGHAISYSYTGSSNTAAYLTYTNNNFTGPNNASGSVIYGNSYLNVTNYSNICTDSGVYNGPQDNNTNTTNNTNDTNSSTNFISIPDGTARGSQLWNASLDGALGGTPLINGDYIYVTNGHNVYCYNINTGALLWNVSSQWGYFHELALHNDVIIAPCAWDKLYFINSTTGALIQNESNIYPGSSIYAPLVVGDMIYISSEYAYDDAWIAVIEYVNGEYVYNGNILEISDVPYGEQGLLSQPVVDINGNIWVNTVEGLVRIDPYTYDYEVVLNGTYGKPVVVDYVIYSLAFDNRIYRIMDNYIDFSDVVTGGLGNSLVFSDYYYVLFFVTDDGVLNVFGYDLWPYASFQLNPTSSNIVSIDGVLYIGDDAGILWVIDASLQDNPILWAYDAGAGILGTPVIADGVVYVGNNETFYALSDVVSRNLIVTNVKSFNALKTSKSSDILSSTNDEEFLTDSFNHVYVSVNGTGDGSSADNPTSLVNAITANIADNTIIHIADGNYEVTSPVTIKSKENITIMADNHGKVNISYKNNNRKVYLTLQSINNFTVMGINFNYTYTLMTFNAVSTGSGANNRIIFSTNILIDKCNFDGNGINYNAIFTSVNPSRNLTISDCNFSNSNARFLSISTNLADYSQQMVSHVSGDCVVNISNCIFNNCSTDALYLTDVKDRTNSPDSIIKHYITNCKFYNTSLTIGVGNQVKTESIFEIKDCIFDIDEGPSIKNTGNSNTFGGIFTFENNSINSDYAIQLGDNSQVISSLTFKILNNESVKVSVNESVDLIGELVDDKGNRIYHAGLKLDVNGSEKSPTINPDNGLYVLSFTPENIGELPIEVKCDFIDELEADIFNLIVSANPNLTVNCNDSVYGEPFNVNVTLNDAVSDENVAFSIVDSAGNVIKSTNSKIDNAFASASFEYIPVGDYTVKVTYDGDENFGTSTVSKAFSISKANSTVQIIIDPTIPVGDNITVQAVLPVNAGGNVTFRLNNTNKTVNITDNAVFDGLSAGNYTIYAIYNGDNNYNPSEEYNITFRVVKVDSNLTIKAENVDWGNNVTVSISTDSRFTGNITVKLGDEEKVAEIKAGSGNVSFANLKADTYNVTAKFNETDLFISSQKDINVTVNRVNATLNLDDIVFDWNKTGSTTISYSGATDVEAVIVETGAVVPIVDNVITLSDLKADTYTLRVTATPDENHTQTIKTITIKVNKVNSTLTLGDDITFDYGNSNSTTVSFTGATNVEAFVVNHQASVETKDGIITVSNLDAGDYTLNVTTQPDENHTGVSKTVNIKVNKVDSDISIMNPVRYVYGNMGQCSVFSEGVINFTAIIVNHTEANITIANGIVNISGLKAGNYTLRVTANPDKNHNSIFRECNVTVKMADVPADQALNITAPADSQSPTFSINLDPSAEGNFTVYVDGKKWDTVKVVNGSASITVANLPAGNHDINISYSGDDNHAPISQNTTLTIKEAAKTPSTNPNKVTPKATKIVAKKKTFKAKKKVKKYTITLKSGKTLLKKVKVTLKVKGKTYKATTNKKGKATFKIKNLKKKGTYKVVIKFKGNKNYKASSKKVKIKVKK